MSVLSIMSTDWAEHLYDQLFKVKSESATHHAESGGSPGVVPSSVNGTVGDDKVSDKPVEQEETVNGSSTEILTVGEPFIIEIDEFFEVDCSSEPPIARDTQADLAWEWANSENSYAGWDADPWTPSGTDVS